jgi:Cd2+/Zn2+-exporting ATPase
LSWSETQIAPLLVLVTLLSMLGSMALQAWTQTTNEWLLLLNLLSYLAGGWYAVQAGWASLKRYEIDVDLLMVAAAVGAALVGAWHEGAMLLFLFSLSNVLQDYAIGRSRHAIQALLQLRPTTATLRRNRQLLTVPIEALKVGDVVVIRPGERLPADGTVSAGMSMVDQATITGESMPVQKQIGDSVFAGTVNQHGSLDVRVTKLAQESTLARIITMVEEAQERHSNAQRALDRFEQTYAKLVISAVLLLMIVSPLVSDIPFSDNFYRAMVVLVVASPCALVISVPASILSGIANAARQGILFKGGGHLEVMAGLKAIAFDKTGTITYGKPRLTDVWPVPGVSETALLKLVASAEAPSEHPVARAILQKAQAVGLSPADPQTFEAIPGRGIVAQVEGQQVLVGSEGLMLERGLSIPIELSEQVQRLESGGKTAMLVYAGAAWQGVIAVADEVRPEAKLALAQLRAAGIQHIVMLTGDNERVAARIAEEVGGIEVHAALLPDQKVAQVEALQRRYGRIAMVGDGVNDAPALATADLGIAMGAAGTDVALETADVVLMADDLLKIAYAYRLSQAARRIIYQNLAFAMSLIVILVIAALIPSLDVPLPLGVVGHEGSTIIVVLNGLRLLVWRGR